MDISNPYQLKHRRDPLAMYREMRAKHTLRYICEFLLWLHAQLNKFLYDQIRVYGIDRSISLSRLIKVHTINNVVV